MCLLQEEAKPPGSDGPLDGVSDPPGMLLCQEASVAAGLCSDLEWVCVSFGARVRNCAPALCAPASVYPCAPQLMEGAGGGREISVWLALGHSVSQCEGSEISRPFCFSVQVITSRLN